MKLNEMYELIKESKTYVDDYETIDEKAFETSKKQPIIGKPVIDESKIKKPKFMKGQKQVKPKGLSMGKIMARYGKAGLIGGGIGAGLGFLGSDEDNELKRTALGGLAGAGVAGGGRYLKGLSKVKSSWANTLLNNLKNLKIK